MTETQAMQDYRDGINACFDGAPFSLSRPPAWRSAYLRAAEEKHALSHHAECLECGEEFRRIKVWQKWCSASCRKLAYAKLGSPGEELNGEGKRA